jgi:hypothetical protein
MDTQHVIALRIPLRRTSSPCGWYAAISQLYFLE